MKGITFLQKIVLLLKFLLRLRLITAKHLVNW